MAGLVSCGIYTNYERPSQAVADMDSLYRPEARPDTTRSIATLRWEELFTDTCLQQLIRQGLAANADLAVARLQVEEAQATLRQSKLAYLPSVQLESTGTLSSFDGQKTQKTYSVGASASWEIDLFGKLRNSKRQALASLLASDAYRQAMQTQVVATVADSYYALLMLDEQIRITEQTAESWREYVRSLAVLMQAGQADRATLAQVEAKLMQAFYAANSARATFYPSITLSGSAGWTNNGGTVANPGAWLLQAVGSLVQPLFNRGQNVANLRIAKAQQEEAVLQFRQSLLDAGNEVNNALTRWQTARERIRLDNGQVEQLTITLGDTELLMENSADTNYLECRFSPL